jgi:adenylate cyclase
VIAAAVIVFLSFIIVSYTRNIKTFPQQASAGAEYKRVSILLPEIEYSCGADKRLTPKETISILNKFTAVTASCVEKTNGNLDLFSSGTAAYWGAPSSSGNEKQDALNCARCALMIRAAIYELNVERAALSAGAAHPFMKFSCGINSGEFAAGTVEGGGRTAYVLAGEAARLAKTAKSKNRAYNADILITESTWRLIHKYIIVREMPPLKIEAGADSVRTVRIFALINLRSGPDEAQAFPATLEDVRSLFTEF